MALFTANALVASSFAAERGASQRIASLSFLLQRRGLSRA
jgi:hypothetical protein